MKVEFSVSTTYINSEVREIVEIPDEDLEGLSKEEQENYIQEVYEDWLFAEENIKTHWRIINEE